MGAMTILFGSLAEPSAKGRDSAVATLVFTVSLSCRVVPGWLPPEPESVNLKGTVFMP